MKLLILILFIGLISAEKECFSDDSCEDFYECKNEICVHKELIAPSVIELIGMALVLIASCIINAGGIEINTIIMSALLIIFNFDAISSVALGHVFIFSGTALFISIRLNERHPIKEKPLIHYDILFLIIGPVIFGESIAVLTNFYLPKIVILICLTTTTGLLLWQTLLKAIDILVHNNKSAKNKRKNYLEETLHYFFSKNTQKNHKILLEASEYPGVNLNYHLTKNSFKGHTYENSVKESRYLNDDSLNMGLVETENPREENHSSLGKFLKQKEKAIITYGSMIYFTILSSISFIFITLYSNSMIFNLEIYSEDS